MDAPTQAQGTMEVAPEDVKSQGSTESAPKTEAKQAPSQPKQAKESGPAPWAKELADRGLDNPEYDAYLREVWQPRMTQYEQQVAEWNNLFGGDMERAQIMAALADALDADPAGAYQQMGDMLRESGLLEAIADDLNGETGDDDYSEDTGDYTDEGDPGADDPVRSWVMERMQQEQMQQQEQQYTALLEELGQSWPGFDQDLFNVLMVAHDGDVDAALEMYGRYHKAPPAPDEPPAVPTLGESPAPTPNPVRRISGIADAVSEFMSEDKARRQGVG